MQRAWKRLSVGCILFLLVPFTALTSAFATDAKDFQSYQTAAKDPQSQTVYITRTGHKYHRDGCRYLSRSKIAVSLSEARQSYTPCKVCQPPR